MENDAVAEEVAATRGGNVAEEVGPADIKAKIVRQLEYYFSDENLHWDKFLFGKISADNGWAKISVLLSFKRLAAISKDPAVIVSAVKNAVGSDLELDETNEKIRRKRGLPVRNKELFAELVKRTIYCKGFPFTATIDDLLNFAATFGDNVITRVTPLKSNTKEFNGSLYFTFATEEHAAEFLNLGSVSYRGAKLECMWQKEFNDKRRQLHQHDHLETRANKVEAMFEYFKTGYVLKADNLNETVDSDSIKNVCSEFKWHVDCVKIVEGEQRVAWIRLKRDKTAKKLLDELADKKNDLNIEFSLPDIKTELSVLLHMTEEFDVVTCDLEEKLEHHK